MMQLTTEADSKLYSLIKSGKSIEEACFEAYPAKEDPIKYALAKQKNLEFVRAYYKTMMADVGLSEKEVVTKLFRAAELAEEDPKASGALLKVVQECHKIYDVYPQQQQKESLHVNSITINDRSQVLHQIFQEAAKEMPEEDIVKMLDSVNIGGLGVIPKKELFDNDDKQSN